MGKEHGRKKIIYPCYVRPMFLKKTLAMVCNHAMRLCEAQASNSPLPPSLTRMHKGSKHKELLRIRREPLYFLEVTEPLHISVVKSLV